MSGTQAHSSGSLSMHNRIMLRRRGLRKGTHSCWECKRRKMRCIFENSAGGTICQGCRRRGTACIGQEVPEEVAFRIINAHETGDAADGVIESPVDIIHVDESASPVFTNRVVNELLTPASTTRGLSQPSANVLSIQRDLSSISASAQNFNTISQHLYAALPSLDDTKKIYKERPPSDVPIYDLMTMPYTILSQDDLGNTLGPVDDVNPRWHPVLIAKHMLMLASSLLHLDPDIHPEIQDLSEEPQVICERMVRLANQFVTSKDEMLGSVELLECVLIESIYHANLGNLRRSWMVARRASSIAQLMGLDHPSRYAQYQVFETSRSFNPQVMWRRIVFLDHFLCVMLSLPAACSDSGWTSDERLSLNSTKGERLERIHCLVASRILELNRNFSVIFDKQRLHDLDSELQRAARSLPTKWWMVPHLDASQADPRTLFWNTGRVFAQVLHYNLVYRLHLPYVFRYPPVDRAYDYSRITCVSACREILTRFLALRKFNGIASSCRIIDFIALMASLTLLLSHLHSQASVSENLLAHQYHSDRAMIEQVQETMKEADQLKSDPLSARSADLLSHLMAIDIYEDDGYVRPANSVSIHPEANAVDHEDEYSVSVQIPYFGLIKIARDSNRNLSFRYSEVQPHLMRKTNAPGSTSAMDVELPGHPSAASTGSAGEYHNIETLTDVSTNMAGSAVPTDLPPSDSSSHGKPVHVVQNAMYPSLAADMEDWTFQGVDFAFFDTIMQSIEVNGDDLEGGMLQSPAI